MNDYDQLEGVNTAKATIADLDIALKNDKKKINISSEDQFKKFDSDED